MNDGWGRALLYSIPGVHNQQSFDLWSLGKDGKPDTGDEVCNWH